MIKYVNSLCKSVPTRHISKEMKTSENVINYDVPISKNFTGDSCSIVKMTQNKFNVLLVNLRLSFDPTVTSLIFYGQNGHTSVRLVRTCFQ